MFEKEIEAERRQAEQLSLRAELLEGVDPNVKHFRALVDLCDSKIELFKIIAEFWEVEALKKKAPSSEKLF